MRANSYIKSQKKTSMKAHITSMVLILVGTLSYAQTPVDTAVLELQKIALKLYGETEETCSQIIDEEAETLSQALEQIQGYRYFKESRTIKLLDLEVHANKLQARGVPFQMPSPLQPNTFFGTDTKAQESSVLKTGHYPTGNHVWCTFHRQCADKRNEQLSIAFYQTFQGVHKNLGEYKHDATTTEAATEEYRNKIALACFIQLLSAGIHKIRTPISNTYQSAASLSALLSTYFLLTPYDFLSGASMNIPELAQEWGAFVLALAGNYYANPAALLSGDALALWLGYILIGSLQSSELWFFSKEKVKGIQQWIDENAEKFIYSALGAEFLAMVFQLVEYQYYQNQIQERRLTFARAARRAAALITMIHEMEQALQPQEA